MSNTIKSNGWISIKLYSKHSHKVSLKTCRKPSKSGVFFSNSMTQNNCGDFEFLFLQSNQQLRKSPRNCWPKKGENGIIRWKSFISNQIMVQKSEKLKIHFMGTETWNLYLFSFSRDGHRQCGEIKIDILLFHLWIFSFYFFFSFSSKKFCYIYNFFLILTTKLLLIL